MSAPRTKNLPVAPPKYSQDDQAQMRKDIEKMDGGNFKKGLDMDLARGERLLLHSPNGSRWQITISNAGVISAVAA